MNRFGLLSLYRSLTRHKLYAALNIGGLAIGIAVFIVLGLYVRFETSFEKWLPNHEETYLIQAEWNIPDSPFNGAFDSTMGGLLEELRAEHPGLVGTRLRGGVDRGSILRGGSSTLTDFVQVDPAFLDVIELPLVAGDRDSALARPNSAIISETLARSLFQDRDPIGRMITATYDEPQNYRVTAVFRDMPDATEINFDIATPLPKNPPNEVWYNWGSSQVQTFVRMEDPRDIPVFEDSMAQLVKRSAIDDLGSDAADVMSLRLQPLAEGHLTPEGQATASLRLTVVTLGIVGVLTLLIAMVNYVNLATARSVLRAREIAIRKVSGATRGAIIAQLLAEAVLNAALACLVGLILAEIALPLVNAAGGLSLAIPYALVIPALIMLAVIIGLAAGSYPALAISVYRPAAVLASSRAPGGGKSATRVREALVALQFGLATAFLIGTLVLAAQMQHVRNSDLGFERDGLLVVNSFDAAALSRSQRVAMIERWKALPGVRSVGIADSAPGGTGTVNFSTVSPPGATGPGPSLRRISTGPDFFEAIGAKPIAGRLLGDEFRLDDVSRRESGQIANILVDRSGSRALGFSDPQEAVGQVVRGANDDYEIVGVVEDLRFFTPREPHAATYFQYNGDMPAFPVANIRFNGNPREIASAVHSVWNEAADNVPFDAGGASMRLAEFYEDDERAARLFAIGAGLAVLIGMVGLWGLASFNTARRVKEIGIRKSLGASATDIVKLLVGQFMRPVLIANLIAWPLAYFAMRTWLAGFDDRIALSPLFFIGASLVAIAIAVLTVLGQSLRASRTAPAWALRHD
ncbi:FtsX-like permease family protein [Citromicrobium bathyomarinum]|uniref:FtsX-like permease family protein n=1 Tax=Citromicrobium bathyomarinum TaxID=72174 RepID=UPI001E31EB39|nr:ABC transporter permease [Citromicrobium bathyomarinum]MCD1623426.1 ABC transporter permease [Citromicrobium bathyomarinum]